MSETGNGASGENSLVAQSELDLQFIQRNIRDLSKTAAFSHMSELEELQQLAYVNLKAHLESGPLKVDPSLALEAFRTLSSVAMQVVETKRKAADTLLKARTLMDIPDRRRGSIIDEDEELPDDAVSEVTVSDGGVFGKLADQETDPNIDMAV